jgi:hypothetical protein
VLGVATVRRLPSRASALLHRLNRLYVALTRAVAGLVILHRQTLPAALRG